MAEYAAREKDYNNGLGDVVGKFAIDLCKADAMAADANFQRIIQVLDPKKYPNVESETEVSLVGIKDPLKTSISIPAVTMMPTSALVPDTALLTLDMTVAAHTEDASALQAKVGAKGSASIPIGPFSAKVEISAEMSVSKESKRSSDYTSTTHAELTMKRVPMSEGVHMLVDAANKTVKKGLQMNDVLINRQVQKAAADSGILPASATDNPPTPEPEPPHGGGGDGGGGN